MPTVDRLEYELGLSNKLKQEGLEAGRQLDELGRKGKQAGKQVEDGGNKGAKGLEKMGRTADTVAQGLAALGAAVAFQRIIQGVDAAVQKFNEFRNAGIGVSSVADRMGESVSEVNQVAMELANDGLASVSDIATGLKNLLATGFNLDQARDLMLAFKDAAAFGRQGALSFGEAIRSATEGVKNGNSILVDNAGITKNLSQMLEEAGFSAQDLSKAASDLNVRMALYNGIMKEAALFQGDAARLSQELGGSLARVQAEAEKTAAKFGEEMAPAVAAVTDAKIALLQSAREWMDENPGLARSLTITAASLTAVATAAAGVPALITAITMAWRGLVIAAGPVGWVAGGISALVAGLLALKANSEAAERALEEQNRKVSDLGRRYEELQRVLDSSTATEKEKAEAQRRLNDLIQEIGELMPEVVARWDSHGRAVEIDTKALQENTKAANENLEAKKKAAELSAQDLLLKHAANLNRLQEQRAELLSKIRAVESGDTMALFDSPTQALALRGAPAEALEARRRGRLKELQNQLAEKEKEIRQESSLLNRAGAMFGEFGEGGLPVGVGAGKNEGAGDTPLNLGDAIRAVQRRVQAGWITAAEGIARLRELEESLANTEEDRLDIALAIQTLQRQTAKAADSEVSKRVRRIETEASLGDITLEQAKEQLKVLKAQAESAEDLLSVRLALRQVDERIAQEQRRQFSEALRDKLFELRTAAPDALRGGLQAFRQEWADFLARPENRDLAQGLQLRIETVGEDVAKAETKRIREPLEGLLTQINRLRAAGAPLADIVEKLHQAYTWAVLIGDEDAMARLKGDIAAAEDALQRARFDQQFRAIAQARENAMAGLGGEAARLQKEIISAQSEIQRLQAQGVDASDAEERLLNLRQLLGRLFGPVLEAERDALQQLLQDADLTADQRIQVERRLNAVLEDLRRQDLDAHRLAEEAKAAASGQDARARAEAERDINRWLSMARESDLRDFRRRLEDRERALDDHIRSLQAQLREFDRQVRLQDLDQQIADLEDQLARAAEEAPLVEFITAGGERILRNPEAERIQEELDRKRQERDREVHRQTLQEQIEAAQEQLQAFREHKQDLIAERQAMWDDILREDAIKWLALNTSTENGLQDWIGQFEEKLPGLVSYIEGQAAKAEAALARINAAMADIDVRSRQVVATPAVEVPDPGSFEMATPAPAAAAVTTTNQVQVDVQFNGPVTKDDAWTIRDAIRTGVTEGLDYEETRRYLRLLDRIR